MTPRGDSYMNEELRNRVEKQISGISSRIRLMRKYLGYTQEQMAELIGVSDRQYRRYENNSSNMGIEALAKASTIDKRFSSSYLLMGRVNEDFAITAGVNKMPEEELMHVIYEYLESTEPDSSLKILKKFIEYGKNHADSANVRNIPIVDIMTRIFEENLMKEIESR